MTISVDANGNTVRAVGIVTEVITPGPALQAEIDAQQAVVSTRATKVDVNKAALDALAVQCKQFANGTTAMPGTLAGLTMLVRKLCEAQARSWYNEKFGDQ